MGGLDTGASSLGRRFRQDSSTFGGRRGSLVVFHSWFESPSFCLYFAGPFDPGSSLPARFLPLKEKIPARPAEQPGTSPFFATIGVCTFRGASRLPALRKALENLEVPEGNTVEVLLVENGSGRSCEGILDPLNRLGRFVYRYHSLDQPGLSKAREVILNQAQGRYIVFFDDDNLPRPDWLVRASEVFDRYPRTGALGGRNLPPPSLAGRLPEWFDWFQNAFAVGEQGSGSGDVTLSRGFLWGAGLAIQREAVIALKEAGFSFLTSGVRGRQRNAGEDSELCKALILLGWRLRYSPDLILEHHLDGERVDWNHLGDLHAAFGRADVIHDLYDARIRGQERTVSLFRRVLRAESERREAGRALKQTSGQESRARENLFWQLQTRRRGQKLQRLVFSLPWIGRWEQEVARLDDRGKERTFRPGSFGESSRILIWGGYGGGNTGDELLLRRCVDEVIRTGASPTILSPIPGLTRRLLPGLDVVEFSRESFAATQHGAQPASPAVIAALESCDELWLTGGGYLTDTFGEFNLRYFLAPIRQAGRSIPLRARPIGLGPFADTELAMLTAEGLTGGRILVRDRTSLALCQSWNIDATLAEDDVWNLNLPQERAETRGEIVCAFFDQPDDPDPGVSRRWWTEIVRALVDRGFVLVGVPFHIDFTQDFAVTAEIFAAAGARVESVLVPELDPVETCRRVAGRRLVLSSRFHLALMARRLGIPAGALASGPYFRQKMESLSTNPGAPLQVWHPGETSAPEALGQIEDLLRHAPIRQ